MMTCAVLCTLVSNSLPTYPHQVPWFEFQDKSHRLGYLRRKLNQLSTPPPPPPPSGSPTGAARLR